jgi:hypothetical protein
MDAGKKCFDKEEIQMAYMLLLMATYFPDHPPLKAFTNVAFQGRKDFITLVENGMSVFAEVEDCTPEQEEFFSKKIQEYPKFSASVTTTPNNITRLSVCHAEN